MSAQAPGKKWHLATKNETLSRGNHKIKSLISLFVFAYTTLPSWKHQFRKDH